ncbi:MAG TPA: hypothetical protein VNO70_26745 [Blastocatellia bacterium]|nr:hypothetical protein [Blastocatellia bacterium]
MSQSGLLTPEVVLTRAEFIAAVERALSESGLDRDAACACLSGLLCDLWNLLEHRARQLPPPPHWKQTPRAALSGR